jgi:adenosylhomocysteine nucleosidase
MSTPGGPTEGTGLVVALPAEAHSLGVHGMHPGDCRRWHDGWIAVSGMGPHNAMRAAERLLACGIARLANWGVAGALDATLSAGDVLIPDRIRYTHDDPGFATDAAASARLVAALSTALRVRRGALWSTPQPVATPSEKRALAERSGAIAVDMEAAPVAAVALRAKLPFVAVKAICDPAARELPAGIVRALEGADEGWSLRMVAAIALGGPGTWRAASALSRDYRRARRSLATAAALAA